MLLRKRQALCVLVCGGWLPAWADAPSLRQRLAHDGMEASITATADDTSRTYVLKTTAPLREGKPPGKSIGFSESPDRPSVRTGDLLFDGLYAMALREAEENAVSRIQNKGYSNGEPIPLEAFETGEKWTYVWTRDLSYSVHLALAGFDPERSASSLFFKTSDFKRSVGRTGRPQILQDTGSGGSYPVSSDRVVWALGAWETMKYLNGNDRESFLRQAFPILCNTIEQDRILIFDPKDGLYRGEESFLDWREQSYPIWTKKDTLPIALSKALSVNVLYHALLRITADCATQVGSETEARRYREWAADLKIAIDRHLYDPEAGLYSAYLISDGLCDIRAKRYELLGNALAVLLGVADEERGRSIIANYPVGPHGPSVVWPQERTVPIYHNQGIWPFVTAYWIKAAAEHDNAAAVTHGIQTMRRLAALNLSNMENYDFVSGLAEVKGRERNGPVVNSRRQLWSVAGYLSMVQDVVFGQQTSMEGLRFSPCIPVELRNGIFRSSDRLEYRNIKFRGKRNHVTVHLPPATDEKTGVLEVGEIVFNGKPTRGSFIPSDRMLATNQWDIRMQPGNEGDSRGILMTDMENPRRLHAPATPVWDGSNDGGIHVEGGLLKLCFSHPDTSNVTFNIYRDGSCVASGISGTEWLDESSGDFQSVAYGYAVEAIDRVTETASHLTPIKRRHGAAYVCVIPAKEMKNKGGRLVARDHFEDWGKPGHELHAEFSVPIDGRYVIRAEFSNGSGPVNTGITCAVKKAIVFESDPGMPVASGYFIMPQSGNWKRWDLSSPVVAALSVGRKYKLTLKEDEHAMNMSYFEQNERYTLKTGGGPGPYNFTNIRALRVELLEKAD